MPHTCSTNSAPNLVLSQRLVEKFIYRELYRKALAAFRPSSRDDFATVGSGHTGPESVGTFTFQVAWLKSAFHDCCPVNFVCRWRLDITSCAHVSDHPRRVRDFRTANIQKQRVKRDWPGTNQASSYINSYNRNPKPHSFFQPTFLGLVKNAVTHKKSNGHAQDIHRV